MRIVLFHTTLPGGNRKPGGVEMVVHRLANALAEGGEDVKVYSLSEAPADARYRHKQLYPLFRWLRENQFCRILLLPFLLNFVRFERADIFHFHGDDWFFFRRRFRRVRTMHGSALLEARSASSWKRRVEQLCIYPLEQLSATLSNITLAIGSATAALYRARHQVDNGVDLQLFRPGRKTAHPQVLYVGTWEGRKRGQFLFELFVKEIAPRYPDARLCMVSDHCPEHPAVFAPRYPSDAELARYFRESWVFAYPSTYEGFGIAYLEALASGTAVLASPNEGARYLLGDGEFGVIAEDAHFGICLAMLLDSPEKRRNFEQRGRERARRFSWEAVAASHKAIYREAMQS